MDRKPRRSRKKPNVWELAKDDDVPIQLQECLKLCGYGSVAAIARITDVTAIEKWFRENHFLFDSDRRNLLYGLYSSAPEKFEFLPGQKQQLDVFIDTCKKMCTQSRGKAAIFSARKQPRKRRARGCMTAKKINNVRTHASSEMTAAEDISSNSESRLNTANLAIQLYEDINLKLSAWCFKQEDEVVKGLRNEEHFKIIVHPKIEVNLAADYNKDDDVIVSDIFQFSASVLCLVCGVTIKLHVRETSFTISNVTRHFAKCVKSRKLINNDDEQSVSVKQDCEISTENPFDFQTMPVE